MLSPRKKDDRQFALDRRQARDSPTKSPNRRRISTPISLEAPEVLNLNIPKEFSVAFSHGCESERAHLLSSRVLLPGTVLAA
jgi:hypothetical protein